MGKALILYFSKYGSTKQYSEWIAKELNGEIISIKNVNENSLKEYDIIILGSGLYAGGIKGTNIIVKNYEILKNKKLIIFTCGLSNFKNSENVDYVMENIKKSIPENIFSNINVFCLRGAIDYTKLTSIHRIMMWMKKKVIMKNEKNRMTEEGKGFLETYGKNVNFINKEEIREIIEYCKNI